MVRAQSESADVDRTGHASGHIEVSEAPDSQQAEAEGTHVWVVVDRSPGPDGLEQSAPVAAFGFVAVLAAVMSSLDAMILTLSSMLVRDVLDRFRPGRGGGADVRAGRWFSVAVAAAAYLLAQVWGSSVFDIAALAFAGFVTLTPTLYLGVRWRRFSAAGAIGSIVAGNVVLLLGRQELLPMFGFRPVFWAFLAALLVALLLGPRGRRPSPATVRTAFGDAGAP